MENNAIEKQYKLFELYMLAGKVHAIESYVSSTEYPDIKVVCAILGINIEKGGCCHERNSES